MGLKTTEIPLFSVLWMLNDLETKFAGCFKESGKGINFWTAGQRIDPSRESTFVWRVTSTNTYSDTVSTMTYTNWYTGQPDNYPGIQDCMRLYSGRSYTWGDYSCSNALCSVCELDL